MKRPAGRKRVIQQHEETMSDILQAVTDASFEADVIEASKTQPVVVDFWADWCRPCHMLTPTVEEIAREHAGKVKIVKLNVDENMNVPGKYSIRGIPTLLVFKGGQVADQIVGAQPKENIVKIIERHTS
jgi:thioredoxin 1